MKLIHIIIIAIALFAIGTIIFAARVTPAYFNQSGSNLETAYSILPYADSTYSLGSNSVRWKAAYIDALHSETITIDGTSAGNMDMSNNLVLNIGATSTDFTATGGLTLMGALSIGTTTPTGDFNVLDSNASTTVYIGDATHSGCIVMGDSDNGGLSYITILDGVIVATSTKPVICK